MDTLNAPLSEDELDQLDRFLMERVPVDEGDTEESDPGITDVSTLDGFFTAIVSAPLPVLPSVWLPALWGDYEADWQSKGEFEEVFTLLVRHLNSIAETLSSHPEDFEPLFYERTVKGRNYLVVDDWCEGYCRGIALTSEDWVSGGEQMNVWLAPVLAFSALTEWTGHDYEDEQVEHLQGLITPGIRKIHAYWLARREPGEIGLQSDLSLEPKAGRDDLCPCGSGKPYKQCCLH